MNIYKRIKTPIGRNLIAGSLGILINLLNQIVLVPFYIIGWGNELYSDWIVLTSITAFFHMSDIGLNTVIQNSFSIKLAEKDHDECNKLLTSNIGVISIVAVLSLSFSSVLCFEVDLREVLGLNQLSNLEAKYILMALIANVFVKMYSSIPNAIYRATHNASRGIYMDYIAVLMSFGITLFIIYFQINLVGLGLLLILPYLLLLPVKFYDARKFYSYKFSRDSIDLDSLKALLVPSVAFLSFPLGNAIVLQGYTLLVNKYFGADSVVLYSTTRTLCNFLKSLLGTIHNSIWPEYSISYGQKDYSRMRTLHRKCIKLSASIAILLAIGLISTGAILFDIWTRGAVEFSNSLMISFLIVLVVESLWTSSSVTLMATNNHSKLGLLYVTSAVLSLALAWSIISWGGSLFVVVLSLLVMHIIMSLYTIKQGAKLTQEDSVWSVFKNKD